MKDNLILQDKNYISARRVHELFGYTSDYVGQLCRSNKLDCKMIGRSWFVTEKSIIDHKTNVNELLKNKSKESRKIAKKDMFENVTPTISTIPTVAIVPVATVPAVIEIPIIPDHPISFVPDVFSLPYIISESFLLSPAYVRPQSFVSNNLTKISLGAGISLIAFVFLFQSAIFSNQISKSSVTASITSASKELAREIWISIFGNGSKNNIVADAEKPPPSFDGLAVVPSSNSNVQDEIIKQKIRDSFSDEVQVKPDKSGTAGVITPVFKKAKGNDFVYVLVPVTNEIKN